MNSSTFLTAVQNLGDRPTSDWNTGDAQMGMPMHSTRRLVLLTVLTLTVGIGIGWMLCSQKELQPLAIPKAGNVLVSHPTPNGRKIERLKIVARPLKDGELDLRDDDWYFDFGERQTIIATAEPK